MTTFLILFIISLCILYFGKRNDKADTFITLTTILLIIVSGLRNKAVGSDTYRYIQSLQNAVYEKWGDLFSNFVEGYVNPDNSIKDPGYQLINKFISEITTEQVPFLILIAVLTLVPLAMFLRKQLETDTNALCFAFVFYVSLMYANLPNQLVRQALSFALILYAYNSLEKHKDYRFFLLVLLASTIHKSALILILYYILVRFVKAKYIIYCAPIVFFTVLMFPEYFIVLAGDAGDVYGAYVNSMYYSSNSKPYLVLVLISLFYSLLLIAFRNRYITEEGHKQGIVGVCMSFALVPVVRIDPNLIRIILYFMVWICVMVPASVNGMKSSKLIYLLLYLALIFKSLGAGEYKFYWQDMQLNDSYYAYANTENVHVKIAVDKHTNVILKYSDIHKSQIC